MTTSKNVGTTAKPETEPQVRVLPRELPTESAWEHFRAYSREQPGTVALWCFGIGFALGWKLKLW